MRTRSPFLPVRAIAWIGVVFFLIWPTVALIGVCLFQGEAPDGGFSFSTRQLGLLWRSSWLSAGATALCILYSLPVVHALGRIAAAPTTCGAGIAALLAASLLCPPMVYAFGWEQVWPGALNPFLRCIVVWALWAWPIPALLIGFGWLRVGRSVSEAASLDASTSANFLYAVLPALRGYVGLSALILFVVFNGEYSVPHACGLMVYATELLGRAAGSSRTIDALWPAIPSVAVTLICLLFLFNKKGIGSRYSLSTGPLQSAKIRWSIPLSFFAVSWLLPIAALVSKLTSVSAVGEAWMTYWRDMAWSLGVAALAGVLVVALGIATVVDPRLRRLAFVWAVVLGALPGALIGESMIAAYNHSAFRWLYDHWPIVTLAYVARFAWVGMLVAAVITVRSGGDLAAQARTDGADEVGILRFIYLPQAAPLLLCAMGVVTALAVGDLATSSLVRVPDFNPIAHVIVEKFHRREDDMLVCLSLFLVAASLPGALLAAWASTRSVRTHVA